MTVKSLVQLDKTLDMKQELTTVWFLSMTPMRRRSSSMSMAMWSPMPGLCTLTATTSPVERRTPLYTCTWEVCQYYY